MKQKITRREFMRLSTVAATTAATVTHGMTPIYSQHHKSIPKSVPTGKKPDMVRLGTIQSGQVPTCTNLKTDPFSKDFSMKDLDQAIENRITWFEGLFAQAAQESCKLVVITEDFTCLSTCMHYLDDRSIFQEAVAKQTVVIVERMAAAARKHSMYIVACYFAREGDKIYNVADLFGPNGAPVGRYRKVHMPQYELWQVTPGDSFPAFETDIGWISMLICYDQMWPEAASCCTMNGAQLICHPSAAILPDYLMRTRAKDNQVHYISATGRNSMISSPRAEILANAEDKDPAIVWTDVNLQNATLGDEFFWEYLYSGIQDHKERHLKFRRPETYHVLTESEPPLAQKYPKGGVANTPAAVEIVYQKSKEMIQRQRQGENVPYHWRW